MSILKELLELIDSAITDKDNIRLNTCVNELNNFLISALQSINFADKDKGNCIDIITHCADNNDHLKQLQTILDLKNQDDDHDLKRLYTALCLLVSNKSQQNDNQISSLDKIISHLRQEIEESMIKDNRKRELKDFSFFSQRSEKQLMFGKSSSHAYDFTNYLENMHLDAWNKDDQNAIVYLITSDKKQFKIRRSTGDAPLSRSKDAGEGIPLGQYIYVISPKGGLYVIDDKNDLPINQDQVHHSTLRAGQPVLSAGRIWFSKGEAIRIDPVSGHYTPSDQSLIMGCLHLNHQGILKENCTIFLMSTRKTITVSDALSDPKYQSLRDEYAKISSKNLTSSSTDIIDGNNAHIKIGKL